MAVVLCIVYSPEEFACTWNTIHNNCQNNNKPGKGVVYPVFCIHNQFDVSKMNVL